MRRDSLFAELRALGADGCAVDGPELAEGGVVCNYGSMSGEDPVMARSTLVSGGQSLVGFILGRALATRSLEQVRATYADLGQQILDGALSASVEKVYPIEEIKAALTHISALKCSVFFSRS